MLDSVHQPPSTQAEEAYRQVRNDIIHGHLKAKEKLRIGALSEKYGIGPTPLREALNRLVSDGFVSITGQRGFAVPPLSTQDLEEITEMRILLENRALQRSIERGDDDWEVNLVAAFHRLSLIEEEGEERDPDKWEHRNAKFHNALIDACSSKWLRRFTAILYDQHRRYRYLARSHLDGRNVHAEHLAIYEAALARQPEQACEANRLHIMNTVETLRNLIDAYSTEDDRRSHG